MGDINKQGLLEEIRKIKYHSKYRLSESPKYRPLVDGSEEFDEIPKLTTEAGEQVDAEKPTIEPTSPIEDKSIADDVPTPAFDAGTDGLLDEPTPANPAGEMINNPEQQVDDIQNEIIKHNLEAMKSIHDQLESLNNVVLGLNSKVQSLSANVEEVREPSDSEKLMSKKNVSYPYYFNLNDYWKGSSFAENNMNSIGGNVNSNNNENKGIRQLPDGTYVADFDDLPQKSRTDVQNSFNDTI